MQFVSRVEGNPSKATDWRLAMGLVMECSFLSRSSASSWRGMSFRTSIDPTSPGGPRGGMVHGSGCMALRSRGS